MGSTLSVPGCCTLQCEPQTCCSRSDTQNKIDGPPSEPISLDAAFPNVSKNRSILLAVSAGGQGNTSSDNWDKARSRQALSQASTVPGGTNHCNDPDDPDAIMTRNLVAATTTLPASSGGNKAVSSSSVTSPNKSGSFSNERRSFSNKSPLTSGSFSSKSMGAAPQNSRDFQRTKSMKFRHVARSYEREARAQSMKAS